MMMMMMMMMFEFEHSIERSAQISFVPICYLPFNYYYTITLHSDAGGGIVVLFDYNKTYTSLLLLWIAIHICLLV